MSDPNSYPSLNLENAIPLEVAREACRALVRVDTFDTYFPIDPETGSPTHSLPYFEEAFAERMIADKDNDGIYRRSFSINAVLVSMLKVYDAKFTTPAEVLVASIDLSGELPQVKYSMPVNVPGHRSKAIQVISTYEVASQKIGRGPKYRVLKRNAKTPKIVENPFFKPTEPGSKGGSMVDRGFTAASRRGQIGTR